MVLASVIFDSAGFMRTTDTTISSEPLGKGDLVLVTGAGGFIGGHLVGELRRQGYSNLRAVDRKSFSDWYQLFDDVDSRVLDLALYDSCLSAAEGAAHIFNLAADMGGMGFIEQNKALCMLSVLPSTFMLIAARDAGAKRFFYSSSACVYAADKQDRADPSPLKEEDAYPAMPEDGYGWEKLFSERMARHFMEDFGLETRVVRYHNVYGPHCAYEGGREKAPAAICRKVIEAQLAGTKEIEVWGDGQQTRSFLYIDDCLSGSLRVMQSDVRDPINLGSEQSISINELIDIVENIAGVTLKRNYKLDAPRGVRGRNSDNTKINRALGWAPSTELRDGMAKTYAWIYDQMASRTHKRTLETSLKCGL
jgi:GDP-D-mannose 3',5'-epimerase